MTKQRHHGKRLIQVILTDEDYAPLEAEARAAGIGVGPLIRMKLKGLTIAHKAA